MKEGRKWSQLLLIQNKTNGKQEHKHFVRLIEVNKKKRKTQKRKQKAIKKTPQKNIKVQAISKTKIIQSKQQHCEI